MASLGGGTIFWRRNFGSSGYNHWSSRSVQGLAISGVTAATLKKTPYIQYIIRHGVLFIWVRSFRVFHNDMMCLVAWIRSHRSKNLYIQPLLPPLWHDLRLGVEISQEWPAAPIITLSPRKDGASPGTSFHFFQSRAPFEVHARNLWCDFASSSGSATYHLLPPKYYSITKISALARYCVSLFHARKHCIEIAWAINAWGAGRADEA